MLWYKAWLETRWRFLIGLAVLVMMACGAVFQYPAVVRLLPLAENVQTGSGILGRAIRDAIEIQRDYRGFIWYQWVRQNFAQMWTLFAVLLGSGGLLAHGSSGALFTLSLPASRNHVLGIRAGACLAELFVLALVPSLLIPLLSPAVGESYSFATALVHAGCMFVAGTAFFSFALLMSTVFSDIWRPLLVTCAIAFMLALSEQIVQNATGYGVFRVMTGESYFRAGAVPWIGLIASGAVSAALLLGATVNFSQQDF
jgi:ABC-2 type transport system permease protein